MAKSKPKTKEKTKSKPKVKVKSKVKAKSKVEKKKDKRDEVHKDAMKYVGAPVTKVSGSAEPTDADLAAIEGGEATETAQAEAEDETTEEVEEVEEKKEMPQQKLELEYVPISKLKKWKANPRDNDGAAEKLAELLGQYGMVVPIIASRDGIIRAGHTRLMAAKKKGLKEVPVIYVDFDSPEDAVMFAVAENRSHEFASWNRVKLSKIFTDKRKANMKHLQEMTGFTRKEIEFTAEKAAEAAGDVTIEEDGYDEDQKFTFRIDGVQADEREQLEAQILELLDGTELKLKVS